MIMNESNVIQELAKRYAEIAQLDIQEQRILQYKQSNSMLGCVPLVLIDEIPWGEMDIDGQLQCISSDPDLRALESYLRRMLYQWKYLQGDMILPNYYPVYIKTSSTSIGLEIKEKTLNTAYSGSGIVAHEYIDQLKTEEDLEKLQIPTITVNHEKTEQLVEKLSALLGDILSVKVLGHSVYCAIWDQIPCYHGVENMLIDLYDRPEFMHKMMQKFTDIKIESYRQMETLNLLEPNPLTVHCTPACSFDLPSKDFDGKAKMKDVWGRGMAQIFATVSPQMQDEFDIHYAQKIYGHCGLVYYGCCEPLDKKIHILRQFKNLRKISITPWADVELAASEIGKDYVLAYKPNPAFVAGSFDAQVVRKEITHVLEACKRNNTQCEFVLKDISTVSGKPSNLIEWEKTATEVIRDFCM